MAFSCNKVVVFVMCTVLLVGTCMVETAQARKVAISRHYGVRTTEPRLLSEKEAESTLLRKNGGDDHNKNKDEKNNKPSTTWGEIFGDEKAYIGNGAMTRDLPYCGPNNKNCLHKASSNPYNRGCNQGERCRNHPRGNAGLKSVGSKNNDHDHDHDDDEPDEESKTTISNGAMGRNQQYCGPNNERCKNKAPANAYTRGCNPGERCRGRPDDDEKTETESKSGDHDNDDDDDDNDKKKSSKSGSDEDEKTSISNGAMGRNQQYCGPNNERCKNKAPANAYTRGCNPGERCRGRPDDDEKTETESKSGDNDNDNDNDEEDDDDKKKSSKSGSDEDEKTSISNGAMGRNQQYCGPNNKRCKNKPPANAYTRGCNPGERCRGRPSDEEKTEFETGEHDDEDDDKKKSSKLKPDDDENKVTIGNGVMRRDSPYCGPLSGGRCYQKQPANEYNRGCNPGEKCRGN